MRKYLFLSFSILFWSCDPGPSKDDSNTIQEANQESSTSAPDANDAIAKPKSAPVVAPAAKQGYAIRVGDEYKVSLLQKSWDSQTSEPSFPSSPDEEINKVTAIYKAGLKCQRRITTTIDGTKTSRDYDCKTQAFVCAKQESKSNCNTETLAKKSFGTQKNPDFFPDSEGKRTTCISRIDIDDANVMLTKSVTEFWTHPVSFAPESHVKRLSSVCSVTISQNNDSEIFDICNPNEAFVANRSKSDWAIADQVYGPGGVEHTATENAIADLAMPDKEEKWDANLQVNCSMTDDTMAVNLSTRYCEEETLHNIGISLSRLATDELSGSQLTSNQFNISLDALDSMTDSTDCKIDIKRDKFNQMVHGTVTCNNSFEFTEASIHLKKASFSCFVPDGYPKFKYAQDEAFAGKEYKTGLFSAKPPEAGNSSTNNTVSNNTGSGSTNGQSTNGQSTNGVTSDGGNSDDSGNSNALLTSGVQYVFVTSQRYTGDLGGHSGANVLCTLIARSSNYSLSGDFIAMISTNNFSMREVVSVPGAVHNIRGQKVAQGHAGLFDKGLEQFFNYDENGNDTPNRAKVLTGSKVDGSSISDQNCKGWTSDSAGDSMLVGRADRKIGTRYRSRSYSCNQAARLYCIQATPQE